MAKTPKNYRNEFLFLSQYVDLKIPKNKKNFSAVEKRKITNAAKSLIQEGLIYKDDNDLKYYPVVKFVKTGKKEKIKGIKNKLSGRFVRGAKPEQKMRGNKIIESHYTKEFIPLDLSHLEEYDTETGELHDEQSVEELIFEELFQPAFANSLDRADYFTVVVANGWEIGRGNFRAPRSKPKNIAEKRRIMDKKAAHIKKFAAGQMPARSKLRTVSREIAEIVMRIFNRNVNRYKMGAQTILGIYLYRFQNQKIPSKKVRKNVSRKKNRHNR